MMKSFLYLLREAVTGITLSLRWADKMLTELMALSVGLIKWLLKSVLILCLERSLVALESSMSIISSSNYERSKEIAILMALTWLIGHWPWSLADVLMDSGIFRAESSLKVFWNWVSCSSFSCPEAGAAAQLGEEGAKPFGQQVFSGSHFRMSGCPPFKGWITLKSEFWLSLFMFISGSKLMDFSKLFLQYISIWSIWLYKCHYLTVHTMI